MKRGWKHARIAETRGFGRTVDRQTANCSAELSGLLPAAGVGAFRRNPENFRVNSGEYERVKSERAEINVVSCRDSESANSRCVRPESPLD